MPKGKRIEPLDLDEMANSSSLNGLMAFRERIPIGLSPIGPHEESSKKKPQSKSFVTESANPSDVANSIVDLSAPIGSEGERLQQPQHNSSVDDPENFQGSISEDAITLAPIGLSPTGETNPVPLLDILSQLSATPPIPKSRGKLVPATKVEDGHSATQNALYWYLWRKGRQVNGSRSHYVQAGYGQIQAALGIDRSNIQDAIRELQKKLALQVLKPSTVGSATVYEVFCCEVILEKRKAEGLVWAHRYGGRKVELLTSPHDNPKSTPIGVVPIGSSPMGFSPARLKPTAGATPTDPVGLTPTGGVGLTPIHSVRGAISKAQSSSDVGRVRLFVESNLDQMDEDAAQKLLLDCANRAGSQQITVEQVIHAVRSKLGAARKANNPIGFLLIAVPKLFPLRSITTEVVRQEEPEEDIEFLQQLLNNPDATEPMKQQAENILSKAVGQKR